MTDDENGVRRQLYERPIAQLAGPDGGFQLFGVSDVDGDTCQAIDLSFLVFHGESSVANPSHGAVRRHDTVFLVIGKRGLAGCRDGDPFTIIRVDAFDPQPGVRVQVDTGSAPDRFETRTDVQHVMFIGRCQPKYRVDVVRQLPKTFFAFPEGPFQRLPF